LTGRSVKKYKTMSPRTEAQFENIRKEKTSLILQTALSLFATHGYASTSVSMIAREAGISKGLLYNYFEKKEDVLIRIIMDGLKQFLGLLQVEDEQNVKKEEIIRFVDENVVMIKKNMPFYKMYFALMFQPDVFSTVQDVALKYFEDVLGVLVNYYIQKGFEDPYEKARFLFAVFDGVAIHYISDPEGFPLDKARDLLIELL